MPIPTLAALATKLAIRLNDTGNGTWDDEDELYPFLNSSRRRTIMKTGCHNGVVDVALSSDKHTYDCYPLVQVKAARIGHLLSPRKMSEMPVFKEDWDNYRGTTPTEWMPVSGSSIRIFPPPNSTAMGMIESLAQAPTAGGTGYVRDDTFTIDSASTDAQGYVSGVSEGVVTSVTLSRDAEGAPYRGYSYTVGTAKATTTVTGVGEGLTVEIESIVSLKAYGVADVDDMGAGMIATVTAAPTAAGTGYTVGDLLHVIETDASNGVVRVATITGAGTTGPVATVTLLQAGMGYSVATGKATSGGTGTSCTVAVATIKDGTTIPITEIPVAFAEEAILLGAEEEARRARPTMFRSLEVADQLHTRWLEICGDIKGAMG